MDEIIESFEKITKCKAIPYAVQSIKVLLSKYDIDTVIQAFEIAHTNYNTETYNYFFALTDGICKGIYN